jgi:glutamyl-tRNA synthetase
MNNTVERKNMRTRFAPSPTGFLHIGGARTALFSWLYARHCQGEFILRIEDTDRERSTQEAVDVILDAMNWLGLDYDEGPFYQMQRMPRYQELIQQLLDEGKAYRCYCSKERLEQLREQQMADKQKPRYDGHCRGLDNNPNKQPFVVRFKNPTEGLVSFDDLVRGKIKVSNNELDDLIIQRTDGTPTYNFTVVADDLDMAITTVVRGDDHISNTPRQINIFHALHATPPKYAHVPMILGSDGKRLSKRHGAMSVTEYREQGYLPQAVLNFLLRLGWSHGDQEIFSQDEMIQLFNLDAVNNSPASLNLEKLQWLNQHYMKNMPAEELELLLLPFLHSVDFTSGPKLIEVINVLVERCNTLVELADKSTCFYIPPESYDEKAARKFFTQDIVPALEYLQQQLANINDWQLDSIKVCIADVMAQFNLKMPTLAQPLRIALTGNTQSPSIDMTLLLMGQQRVLADLAGALDFIAQQK